VLTPYYQDELVTLYHGDTRIIAPQISLDGMPARRHVICDAPYTPHTHEKSRAGARKTPLRNRDGNVSQGSISRAVDFGFAPLSSALRHTLADEAARLTTGWTLFFSDAEGVGAWRSALAEAQLENVRLGAWVKLCSTPQFTGDRPGVGFEAIVIAHATDGGKPVKKHWNGGGKPALWSYEIVLERGGTDIGEARLHETQKPEDLMCALIEDFTDPGDMILDFTAGACTTLVCAKRLGRMGIGIELRERDCENGAKRLRGEATGIGYTPAMRLGQQGLFA
jgi:hypothetical protein